jgi:hypothetical protein
MERILLMTFSREVFLVAEGAASLLEGACNGVHADGELQGPMRPGSQRLRTGM